MKKDSIIDYATYTLFRILGAVMRGLPLGCALSIGRGVGDIFYFIDTKHKVIVYANLKMVFKQDCGSRQLNRLTRKFYRHFGQSLVEILLIPRIDGDYIKKYITIEGREHIERAFARGKGVIFTGLHEGSWELYNIITANLGFPFHFLVRDQGVRFRKMVALLNEYRRQKGCRLIYRSGRYSEKDDDISGGENLRSVRELIKVLGANEALGMSVDQGGKTGANVSFFGRDASMATGALRLALKYDAAIIPSFITRLKGPYNTIFLEPPLELARTGDTEYDVRFNLQRLIEIYEKHVREHPQEYLWTYKVWKYSTGRTVLILDDGKTGHLRQSQAVARLAEAHYRERGYTARTETVGVDFRGPFGRCALKISTLFAGRSGCQGCSLCLKAGLDRRTYARLAQINPDLVISCGSSLTGINYVISRENNCRSVVVMKPAYTELRKFDLVIIPEHDRPPHRKNVITTQGALNLIDEEYLGGQVRKLRETMGPRLKAQSGYVGILLGGDSKGFSLKPQMIHTVARQIKSFCEDTDTRILVTTSRRSSRAVEEAVKDEFGAYERCDLMVIANEKNLPEAVGGILGLSSYVVCSPESISMISEAAQSNKYVAVFDDEDIRAKHRHFLREAARRELLRLEAPEGIKSALVYFKRHKPAIRTLPDNKTVKEALSHIL